MEKTPHREGSSSPCQPDVTAILHAARPKPSALIYIVEGEIAAGKTELVRALTATLRERGHRVCPIFEPVDRWREIGILAKFYSDRGRFGYGFQTYAFATRVLAIAAAIAEDPFADVYLLERSPATDPIFMELQRDVVDEVEMRMYYTWCAAYRLLLPLDLAAARVLYLKTSLPLCMERLAARSREGEIGETLPSSMVLSEPDPLEEPATLTATGAGATGIPPSLSLLPEPQDAKPAAGGVTIEYQAQLRRAHEVYFSGEYSPEFPHMPRSPFPRGAVMEIDTHLADGNFRDAGLERDQIVAAIVRKMGF